MESSKKITNVHFS